MLDPERVARARRGPRLGHGVAHECPGGAVPRLGPGDLGLHDRAGGHGSRAHGVALAGGQLHHLVEGAAGEAEADGADAEGERPEEGEPVERAVGDGLLADDLGPATLGDEAPRARRSRCCPNRAAPSCTRCRAARPGPARRGRTAPAGRRREGRARRVVHHDRPAADPRAVGRARAPLPVPADEQPALDRPGAALWCGVAAGDGPRVAVDLLGPSLRQVAAEQGGRGGDHPAPGRPGLERGQRLERVEQHRAPTARARRSAPAPRPRPRPVSTSGARQVGREPAQLLDLRRPPVGLAAERRDGVAQLGHPIVAGGGAGGVDHPSILPQEHGMPPHLGQPSAKRRSRAVEVDAGDVGQRGDPGQDVRELVALLVDRALAQRLGQLPDLLGQPGDRSRQAPLPVARVP